MYNVVVTGGAIHAAESRIDVKGEIVVVNNRALDNGGGIYLYCSEFNCMMGYTSRIVSNCTKKMEEESIPSVQP